MVSIYMILQLIVRIVNTHQKSINIVFFINLIQLLVNNINVNYVIQITHLN